MVSKKELGSMPDGKLIETVCFMKSYSKRPTKNGSSYMSGSLEMKGTVDFKVWAGSLFDEMDTYDYQNTVVFIKGKVNDYGGVKSLILSSVKAVEDGVYSESDFFEEKYAIESYVGALDQIIESHCSEQATSIYREVMSPIMDRFKVEFAARSHHDAVKGGLLAHTYKVLLIMCKTVSFYPNISKVCSGDLLYLGCVFHDIGKIYEYTNGSIIGNGLLVSHHTFGVEILLKYKEKFVDSFGEGFFYRLLSIVEQHHGEYGEEPRTVEAYLIHLVDNLESKFESLDESFQNMSGERSMTTVDSFKLN